MGLFTWLVEEATEWFTSEPVGSVHGATDLVDPLAASGDAEASHNRSPLGDPATKTDPVLNSVSQSMAEASQSYRDAMGTDTVRTGTQSTLDLIHTVHTASPEQLTHLGQQLEGINAADEIRQSVAESQQQLAESKADHEVRTQANSAEIYADAVSGEVEALLKKSQSEL